jgi:hypothetical protein
VERLYAERLLDRPKPRVVESGPVQMGLAAAD